MDYGGGDHYTADQAVQFYMDFRSCKKSVQFKGRRSVCGRRLSLRSILYANFVCDMNNAAAAAVCGLRRYTSAICLCLSCMNNESASLETGISSYPDAHS